MTSALCGRETEVAVTQRPLPPEEKQCLTRKAERGLRKPKYTWRSEYEAYPKDHYFGGLNRRFKVLNRMIRMTGLPRWYIKRQAARLGLTMHMDRRPWTGAELDRLENMVGQVSTATIAKRLGRPESSCKLHAILLKNKQRSFAVVGFESAPVDWMGRKFFVRHVGRSEGARRLAQNRANYGVLQSPPTFQRRARFPEQSQISQRTTESFKQYAKHAGYWPYSSSPHSTKKVTAPCGRSVPAMRIWKPDCHDRELVSQGNRRASQGRCTKGRPELAPAYRPRCGLALVYRRFLPPKLA